MGHNPFLEPARRASPRSGARAARSIAASVALLLVFVFASPHEAAAQGKGHGHPAWVSDIAVASANIVVGGVTAAVTALIRGEDVSEAFLKGAAGGGVVFAGKRVAAERFDGAGLLGRQIASVGSSMVADAGLGRDLFTEIWLPLGPVWVQVRPEARWRARVNLHDVGSVIWAATRPELRFDLGRSLSNGAPVFVADQHLILVDGEVAFGFAVGGTVVIGGTARDAERVQRHENIHVLQHDYFVMTVTRRVERWVWRRLTTREIPLDFGFPAALISLVSWDNTLLQSEAEVFESR
ncbi:MAG: hypothetical protein FWJ74_00180 [Gemmatimonadota bacterium]